MDCRSRDEVQAEASATKGLVMTRDARVAGQVRAPSTTFTPHSCSSPIRRNVSTPAMHDSSCLWSSARYTPNIESWIDYNNVEAFYISQAAATALA